MMKVIFVTLLLVGISTAFNVPHDNERVKRKTDIERENELCECVPYYQCNYKGTMNENGEGIIDIKLGLVGTADSPTSARRPCEHYLSVCCLPPEMIQGHDTQSNGHDGNNPGVDQGGQQPGGGNQGGNYPDDGQGGHQPGGGNQGGNNPGGNQGGLQPGGGNQGGNNPDDGQGGQGGNGGNGGIIGQNHVNRGCGYRNPNGIGFRITGNHDNEAQFAEFPWMVAVLKDDVVKGKRAKIYACGGSLIHKRVVLTAAHCVHGKSPNELAIRAGEWDTQTVNEPLRHQDRQVSVVTSHPGYKKDILFNDFALLILAQPVDLADNVEVVCLPEQNERFDHSRCFATGWGKSQFGEEGNFQVILKSVELPIVPHDRCQESLRQTRLGRYFKLNESFMCAGGVNGLDTCTGDGGSPLVCPLPHDPTRYAQAGIVAWGIGCGRDNVPGVYADVAKGRKWIDEVLASYNIDSISYSPGGNNNYPPAQPQQPFPGGHQQQQPNQPNFNVFGQ